MNQATARKIQQIQSYNAADTSTTILESQKQIQEIVVLANKYKFFAMDCEWVPQPNHKKIALIQLSFPNGKCFLLRAHKVDREILKLLQDTDIIKIGLGHLERDKDYGRLQSQYNISPVGLVDIRHFVKELDPNYPDCGRETRYGLQALAKHYLNVPNYFDYSDHQNWENDPLEEYQVMYAANDVLAIMAICLKITFNECQPRTDFDRLVSLARNEGMQWIDQQFNQFSPRPPIRLPIDLHHSNQELQHQQDSTDENSYFSSRNLAIAGIAGLAIAGLAGFIAAAAATDNDEEPRNPRDPRDPRDPRSPRDPRDPRESRDPRGPRDPRSPRDPRDPRNPRDPRVPRDPRESQGSQED